MGLQPSFYIQTQGAMNRGDESRGKGLASTLTSASTNPEPSKKARKDKKKKQHRDKRDSRELKDFTTPASVKTSKKWIRFG